jgi:hypothetical protein
MNYFAIYLDETFVGFITEESQKAFFLETNPNYKFYQFIWNHDFLPMPSNVLVVNNEIQVII